MAIDWGTVAATGIVSAVASWGIALGDRKFARQRWTTEREDERRQRRAARLVPHLQAVYDLVDGNETIKLRGNDVNVISWHVSIYKAMAPLLLPERHPVQVAAQELLLAGEVAMWSTLPPGDEEGARLRLELDQRRAMRRFKEAILQEIEVLSE